MHHLKISGLIGALAVASMLGACATSPNNFVPADYQTGTTLDRNEIGVGETSQRLELAIDSRSAWLRAGQEDRVRAFISNYRRSGHGVLIVAVPSSYGADPYSVAAVSEARDIAWAEGVAFDDVRARAYDAGGRRDAPLILTYQSYVAIAPYCPEKSQVRFSDIRSNNDMPALGCSIRVNQAAMIADPSDLFGNRPLDEGDALRRQAQLELFREGQPTGAERGDDETSAVSTAVN
ncbi:CpaD family pilus assembly protein [Henriciella marina]|uniref:CpaD family pilus assembly lipoprotein n=1 Tax=Henriciella marina TaxID=453851 RepID=A0ABT4LTF4_9PROT|nr:CpaD family pilus assembly lipoprotein [Henriciella marina]MCZ4297488.1 CpaD family pilus assembly lipoprotein [Henriciella marina]